MSLATGEKITCSRCGKKMAESNFYTYKDGSKCEICKPCLTAYVDNFDPTTFEWILEKLDVPYIPQEWNVLRDRAFAKDPFKMNGMSVIGKYIAKMKLKQWNSYSYKDSEAIQQSLTENESGKEQRSQEQKKQFQAQMKEKFDNGEITEAEYKTLVSVQTQNENLNGDRGNVITGVRPTDLLNKSSSYAQALQQLKNPFQENNFLPQSDLIGAEADLSHEDQIYLAMKWGRLYSPAQWVALEKMYKEFMNSFDIQGAARIDTLKKICKTSLKMDQAIDSGDIQTYQKLSRVYDTMMKSAKFTEAQNKDKEGGEIDSASAIVDFVESHAGQIPKYECKQPQDLVDKIIIDLKNYNKSLIYEDKSLAQQIEKYLQDRRNMQQMRIDREQAQEKGLDQVQLQDDDFVEFNTTYQNMTEHDEALDETRIEEEFNKRRIKIEK